MKFQFKFGDELLKKSEEEPKLRKANSLSSPKDLDLDKKVYNYIRGKHLSSEEVVMAGRRYYYKNHQGAIYPKKWLEHVSSVLDREGFIRHDLDERTFMVGKLYRAVYEPIGRRTPYVFASFEEIGTNEQYERCQRIDDARFEEILAIIDNHLVKNEAKVIKLRFGLDPEALHKGSWTYGDIGRLCGFSCERARHVCCYALRHLRTANLPPIA